MNKFRKNIGLTLVELVISSLLISIIMLGIVSFNSSFKQIQSNNINDNTSGFAANVAMNYLRNDITNAVGNYPADTGIETRITPNTYMCLRQPLSSGPTPMTFSNNPWVCYFFDSTSSSLARCNLTPGSNPKTTAMTMSVNCAGTPQYLATLQSGNFFPTSYAPPNPVVITLKVIDNNRVYTLQSTINLLSHSR